MHRVAIAVAVLTLNNTVSAAQVVSPQAAPVAVSPSVITRGALLRVWMSKLEIRDEMARVRSLRGDTLELAFANRDGPELLLSQIDSAKVRLRREGSLGAGGGAIIGLLGGAVVGGSLAKASCAPNDDMCGLKVGVGVVFGGLLGIISGALIGNNRSFYWAPIALRP